MSKDAKQKVARKKMPIKSATVRFDIVWEYCARRGRCMTFSVLGFQLSGSMKATQMKLIPVRVAATQPGPINPNHLMLNPPSAGPNTNPRPNAIPIKPMRAERFSGGVMPAM